MSSNSIDPSCHICQGTGEVRVRRYRPGSFPLCETCRKLAGRRFNKRRGRQRDRIVEVPTKPEWIETLRAAWDPNASCFRCMVSGIPLLVDAPASPRYPTLEHTAPGTGQGGWLVVAAAINDMKSDFGLDEVKAVVPLLARAIRPNGDTQASSDLRAVLDSLRHWRRVKTASVPDAIAVDDSE